MAGGFSIASFNLWNFNYDTRIGGAPLQKTAKAKRFCEIIRDGGYHIVALQEVQTPETVASLVNQLNGGNPNGRYSYVHCHNFYETISRDRFKSHTTNQTRGELAFIYDSESVELFRDYAVYKRLHERLWLALDHFIYETIRLLPALLADAIYNGQDEEDESEQNHENRKRAKNKIKSVATTGTGILGGTAVGVGTGVLANRGAGNAHEYIEWQLKRMRPPFVAFFCRKVGGIVDKSRQLRLINVHSQYGRTEADKKYSTDAKIRKKEAEYVLREAFQIVKSEQTEDTSLALTMALGDFNQSGNALQKIAEGVNSMPMRNDRIVIGVTKNASKPKAHLTTVKKLDAPKNGEKYDYSRDYDHFAFDMDVWSPHDAKRAFGLENEKFFVFEGLEPCAISDHLPVEITTSLF